MKTQPILASFLIFFCVNPLLKAQDKKASDILDQIQTKTQSYTSMKFEFTYSMENKSQGINESMDGVLFIKGDSYRLTIAGQEVICDGETVWTFIKDANEVQINYVEEGNDAITPSKLFTSYNKNYKSKYIKEINENGKAVQVIDLTPIEGRSFSRIELKVEKGLNEILSFTVFDKNGSTYSYKVIRFLHDVPMEADKFIFKQENYPGAEIIDMR
jgi:outer membrane lipoprotein-sorting protein